MRKIQGTCCISWYKGIMTLEREINTAELLLIKLAHQPLFCFAVWKTSLNREIQWYLISGKTGHDCWFFCPGCTHYVNMNQGLYLLFHYLRQGAASLIAISWLDGHKKRRCFLSQRRINSVFLGISK